MPWPKVFYKHFHKEGNSKDNYWKLHPEIELMNQTKNWKLLAQSKDKENEKISDCMKVSDNLSLIAEPKFAMRMEEQERLFVVKTSENING